MSTPMSLKRIPLVKNTRYQKSGPKSYGYLLQKYNITPTKEGPLYSGARADTQGKFKAAIGSAVGGKTSLKQHVLMKKSATGSPGEVEATDIQHDAEYLCPVTIGTPGQTVMLDFDTGSADTWCWSTELPKATLTSYSKGHTIFDPSKSSTFAPKKGYKWKIQYGDNSSASGIVGNDDLTVGGIVVEGQAIELANKLSTQFETSAGDGLLGLAFSDINTVTPTSVATPVDNMITQDDIPKSKELFTAYLGSWRDANDPDHGQSFYTFGFIDQEVLKASRTTASKIYYTKIDKSQGFWEFPSTSAAVNGAEIARSGNTAIADTGTTLALVSDELCEAVYAAIPGAKYDSQNQGYTYPARTTAAHLPVVKVAVGSKLFTIQKEDLGFADAGNGMVYGGIQSRGELPFDILGDTFLKGVYAIFDQGNERFGCVQRIDPTTNLDLPPAEEEA